jgi:predicted phosphoribosyltransferase
VAAADSLHALEADADTVVAFEVRADFFAVGQFYASFGQTQDEEVKAVLSRARGSGPAPPN